MLTIKIKTDNAAFHSPELNVFSKHDECAKILRRIADDLESAQRVGVCVDSNGNNVGTFTLTTR